nr:hypothetical protein [Ophiocordyceps sp.]
MNKKFSTFNKKYTECTKSELDRKKKLKLEKTAEMYKKLIALKEKINKHKYLCSQSRSEVNKLAEEFISKHNTINTDTVLGRRMNKYNIKMDKDNLISHLLACKEDEKKIITLVNNLYSLEEIKQDNFSENLPLDLDFNEEDSNLFDNNPSLNYYFLEQEIKPDTLSYNELLDYAYRKLLRHNGPIIYNIDNIFERIDSVEVDTTGSTSIRTDICLISEQLKYSLKKGKYDKNLLKPSKNNENSFYVVIFNILKTKDLKTNKVKYNLIYNYIQYNMVFIDLFYFYIKIQHMATVLPVNPYDYKLGSSYYFCIDNNLMTKEKFNILSTIPDENKPRYYKSFNSIDLYKLIGNGELKNMNYSTMSAIINNLFNNNPWENVLYCLRYDRDKINKVKNLKKKEELESNEKLQIINLLSRFIFVVSDLKDFQDTLKNEYPEFKSLNTGSQKFRGSISYLSNILNRLDKDFRDSMYCHNLHHYENKALRKDKFSFKNIHINLGYVRWYSTIRNVY